MIEMGKKYQTRDGRAVWILATSLKGTTSPVLGIVTSSNGVDDDCRWTSDGYYYSAYQGQHLHNSGLDLIPVPTKHEGWMPVSYDKDAGYWINGRIYDSPQEVHFAESGKTRIAHVTWES